MANTQSNLYGFLADPQSREPVQLNHARVRTKISTVTFAGTELTGHIFVLGRFMATDILCDFRFLRDAMTGVTAADLGIYEAGDWTAADQTAVDADCYVTSLNLAAASLALGSGVTLVDLDAAYQQIWEVADVSTQPAPGTEYDLCITTNANLTASGTLRARIEYIAGD